MDGTDMDGTENGTHAVVVGVDGSPGSRAALEFALADAARRGVRLRVIAAARPPEYWATSYGMIAPLPMTEILAQVEAAAQQMADDEAAAHPDLAALVPISVEARAGIAAEVLVEVSQGADVLVLGHRGRGALSSAMLGSVGLQCVVHATCPVTVVHPVPVAAATGAATSD